MRSGTVIQVFARLPQRGCVKTRLQASLGKHMALHVYRALLRYTLSQVTRLSLRKELWIAGGCAHPLIHQSRTAFRLCHQQGNDLGHRMQHAIRQGLASARHVILIGTDCAALCPADIEQAQRSLEQGADLVLGPANDGGYYLIGLSRPRPALFQGIEWGGTAVLEQTLKRAARLGMSVDLLQVHDDIDTATDLNRVPELMEIPFRGL